MTIAVQNNRVVATGNGVTTQWPFNFSASSGSEIEVYLYEIASGELEGPISSSLYSVVGIPGNSGYVDLDGDPLAATHKIIIQRIVPLLQPNQYNNAAGFDPATLTLRLDDIVRGLQQVNDAAQRAVKVDISDTKSAEVLSEEFFTAAANAVIAADEASGSAINAAASALAAAGSASTALAAKDAAVVAKGQAETARDAALLAQGAAENAADLAEAARISTQADKVTASLAADTATQAAADALQAAGAIFAYGDFNSRYLGEHATAPTNWNEESPLDPGTDSLVPGLIYWDTVAEEFLTYTGSEWASGQGNTSDFARISLNGSDYNAATFRTNIDVYSVGQIDAMPGAVPAKTTPVDADSWQIWDSVASAWKRVTGTNLKVYIKALTDTLYQPLAAKLTALAAQTWAANSFTYYTDANTPAIGTITSAGRALIDDADAAAQRTTLGVKSGATRDVTISTSAPSGGVDGDLWFRV